MHKLSMFLLSHKRRKTLDLKMEILSNLPKVTPLLSDWGKVYAHICPNLEIYAIFTINKMSWVYVMGKTVDYSPEENLVIKFSTDSYLEKRTDCPANVLTHREGDGWGEVTTPWIDEGFKSCRHNFLFERHLIMNVVRMNKLDANVSLKKS